MQDTTSIWTEKHNDGNFDWISDHDRAIMTKEGGSSTSASDADTDDSERSDLESNQLQQIDCENEFGDTKLEELVKSEGPQEILQLTIQVTRSQVMGRNPIEGFTKSSCGKLNLVARSRLPALERGRGSSWEPRD